MTEGPGAAAVVPAWGDDPLDGVLVQLPRRSLVGLIAYSWRHKFTPAGRSLVGSAVIAGAIASGFGIAYPGYVLAVLLVVFLFAAQGAAVVFRPRVTVERRLPDRCAAGATVTVAARVTHVGRLPAFDLAVRELAEPVGLRTDPAPERADALWPGESVALDYRLFPVRRGAYDLPGPQVLTSFPFGVYDTVRKLDDPHRLLVTPRFTPLARLDLPAGHRHQPGGLALVSRVGESEEFVGNREYRSGDRLRDIDHRAWARRGAPIVREYQQEYLTRIALVVDTHVPRPSRRGLRTLEAGVSLGAAVADALSRQEYIIDLFAAGPDLFHFQAGRSLAFLDDVLDVLACVEACPRDPFPTLGPAVMGSLGQLSTAVLVFLDWDDSREAFARSLAERGVQTKVVVVHEGATRRDPTGFQGGAGAVIRLTADEVERGVEVL